MIAPTKGVWGEERDGGLNDGVTVRALLREKKEKGVCSIGVVISFRG